MKVWHKSFESTTEISRYEEVYSHIYDIADIPTEFDEKCRVTLRTLQNLKTKLENTLSSKESNDAELFQIELTLSKGVSDVRSNDWRVLSPLSVRSKERSG